MKNKLLACSAAFAILGLSLFADRAHAQTPAEPPLARPSSTATSQSPASTASSSGTTPPPGYPENPAPPRESRTAENSVFPELLGNGGLYSINYERIFGDAI